MAPSSGAIVSNGGAETVFCGGSVIGTTIKGGIEELNAGARSGGIIFAIRGQLLIDGTVMPAGAINSSLLDDTILTWVGFDSSGSVTLSSGDVPQVVESGQTFNLNSSPARSFACKQFRLSAKSSGGTDITVTGGSGAPFVSNGQVPNVFSNPTSNGIFGLDGATLTAQHSGTER